MENRNHSEAGMFSGLLAAIMIVALSVMALTSLTPAREPPMRVADAGIALPDLPTHSNLPSGG